MIVHRSRCRGSLAIVVALLLGGLTTAPGANVQDAFTARAAGTVQAVAFSPDGSMLAIAGSAPRVQIFNPFKGDEQRAMPVSQGGIEAIAFHPAGDRLAAGRYNELWIWNPADGKLIHHVRRRIGRILAMAYSPSGRYLVTSGSDRVVRVFDTNDYQERDPLPSSHVVTPALSFAPRRDTVVGALGSRLTIWDLEAPDKPVTLDGHQGRVSAVLFGPGDESVISGGWDKKILFWNTTQAAHTGSCSDHKGRITALALSRNGKLLASAGTDKTIVLRDPKAGLPRHRIDTLKREALCLALSPDGLTLAAGTRGPGDNLLVWRIHPQLAGGGTAAPAAGAPPTDTGMNAIEKAVLIETNLARTRPATYADFARAHRERFDGRVYVRADGARITTHEGTTAVDEAIAFLAKAKPLKPLSACKGLAHAARDHVKDIGPKGILAHEGSDGSTPSQRMNRYGQWLDTSGENISFGRLDARDIVLLLIIDDGVPDRGHRVNLFNPDFKTAGVAIGIHAKYGTMCVIDHAGGFKEKR